MNNYQQPNSQNYGGNPQMAQNLPPWARNQNTVDSYGKPYNANPPTQITNQFAPSNVNQVNTTSNNFPITTAPHPYVANQTANMNKVFPTPTQNSSNTSGNMNNVFPSPTYNRSNTGGSRGEMNDYRPSQPQSNTNKVISPPQSNKQSNTSNISRGFLGGPIPNQAPGNNQYNNPTPNTYQAQYSGGPMPNQFSGNNQYNYSNQNSGPNYNPSSNINRPMNSGPKPSNPNERVYYTNESGERTKVIEKTIYKDNSNPNSMNVNTRSPNDKDVSNLLKQVEHYKKLAGQKAPNQAGNNATKDTKVPNNFDYAKTTTNLMLQIEKLKAGNNSPKNPVLQQQKSPNKLQNRLLQPDSGKLQKQLEELQQENYDMKCKNKTLEEQLVY